MKFYKFCNWIVFLGISLNLFFCTSPDKYIPGPINLLKNGGFEMENGFLSAWEIRNTDKANFSRDTDIKHTGSSSLKISILNEWSRGEQSFSLIQALPIEYCRGNILRFGGQIKTAGAGVGIYLTTPQGDSEHLEDRTHLPQFTRFEKYFSVPKEAAQIYLVISVFGAPRNTVWLDDFYVSIKTESKDLLPLYAAKMNPDKINTLGWQDSPYITPDGNTLYFMYTPFNGIHMSRGELKRLGPERKGHHSNQNADDSDIYVTHKLADGSWSVPENLGFNTIYPDHSGMPNRNGNRFYYIRSDLPYHRHGDIYAVNKNNGGSWENPVNLGSPPNSPYVEDNPHISADEQTLFFESNRPGGFGGFDLYYSKKTDRGWNEPVNMGPIINTENNESQIWVSSDENTIYFNRDCSKKGNTQIYYAQKNGQQSWHPPVHLDLGLPLVGEASLTDDEKQLYFASIDPHSFQICIMHCRRMEDQTWSRPQTID